jgi:hypothetical protein
MAREIHHVDMAVVSVMTKALPAHERYRTLGFCPTQLSAVALPEPDLSSTCLHPIFFHHRSSQFPFDFHDLPWQKACRLGICHFPYH